MYIFVSENKIRTAREEDTLFDLLRNFKLIQLSSEEIDTTIRREIYKWQCIKILGKYSLNALQELMINELMIFSFRKSFKLPFALSRLESEAKKMTIN